VRPGDRLEGAARLRREADGLRSQLEAAERLADAATARVQEARDALAEEDRDVEGLEPLLGEVDALWQAALDDQDEWAVRNDPATAGKVVETSRRRGELLAEDAEGREAHAAGMVAREHLRGALSLLGEAHSWSSWDTFGGGGVFTDLMK